MPGLVYSCILHPTVFDSSEQEVIDNVRQPLMSREREFQHREDDTEYDVE